MQMSMFSAEELHVSRSASPDFARDWIDVAGYAACGGEVAVK